MYGEKYSKAAYLLPEIWYKSLSRFGIMDVLDAPDGVDGLGAPFVRSTVMEYPTQKVKFERGETLVLESRHVANKKRNEKRLKRQKMNCILT